MIAHLQPVAEAIGWTVIIATALWAVALLAAPPVHVIRRHQRHRRLNQAAAIRLDTWVTHRGTPTPTARRSGK